ncbi:opgC protein [Aureimonas sp. Leaf454]|uniref:OpgC family protein n=1 Tax=Aureimonas sp. Leaf454 TaxID=1736381 RepID=UPI0006F99A80|nr:OpgC domain-containing protein [Aureimonas sp. Leaf454]KQT46225.1 opgC protein [Aureimonas sp. Leaf454]
MPSTELRVPALAGQRDHRVDFYRGIALAMIFVNHVPGNVWESFTTRNFGFSDAAEVFVFLAGFASAFAYGKPFFAGNVVDATLKAWRRAGILYMVHIVLTTVAIAAFAWATLAFGKGGLLHQIGLGEILTHPLETLVGVATLGHQLGYVNILPMYTVLLLMLPLHLALARISPRTMLAGAVLLWAATGAFRLDIPNFPLPGGWFFNPFAWQLLFAIGLYCGLTKWQRDAPAVPYHPVLYGAALVYLAFAFVFVGLDVWGVERQLGLPMLIGQFDKSFVSLPRLLHVLAMIYVFAHAPASSPIASIARGNPFALLGRHALPVFAMGTVLSLIGQIVKFERPPAFLFDTAMVIVGLSLQFALAHALERRRQGRSTARKAPSPAPVPQPAAGATAPARHRPVLG